MTGTVKNNIAAEEWRDIKGYEGLYQVSNLGRVRSLKRSTMKMMKPAHKRLGYLKINLRRNNEVKTLLLHRLVAEAFLPNPDNLPIINHKDEDKTNNHVDNLEWCTVMYNNHYNNGYERRKEGMKRYVRTPEHSKKLAEAVKKYHSEHPEAGLAISRRTKEYCLTHQQELREKAQRLREYSLRPEIWEANREKQRGTMKPIVQLDKDGNFIREWDAVRGAARTLNIRQGNIQSCCKGRLKTAYGFIWKYKSDYEKGL